MSASAWVWIGSFFSVWLMIGPDIVALGEEEVDAIDVLSCAIETTRGSSGSLASRITSPVEGSTTSAAA